MLNVRREKVSDAGPIRELVGEAFETAAVSCGYEAQIVDALRDARALDISLVAETDSGLVGHVAFSAVTIDQQDLGWYGLGPLAVVPRHQGNGIGTALVKSGLRRLRRAGANGAVVVGDPDFYGKFGFSARPHLRLDGVPSRHFLALPLTSDVPAGEVAYHAAFDAV